jgi:signal transduction histidine kinase
MANNKLHLEIWDKGRGIPSGHRHGLGLQSMRQRAEELGGRFQIASSQNGGTKILVDLPLNTHEE